MAAIYYGPGSPRYEAAQARLAEKPASEQDKKTGAALQEELTKTGNVNGYIQTLIKNYANVKSARAEFGCADTKFAIEYKYDPATGISGTTNNIRADIGPGQLAKLFAKGCHVETTVETYHVGKPDPAYQKALQDADVATKAPK